MAQIGGVQLLREFEVIDDSIPIRRFISFEKFKYLITKKKLYFSPASQFEDDREGYYTNRDYQNSEKQLTNWGLDANALNIASEARKKIAGISQSAVVISCWTTAPINDSRMWEEYAKTSDSVVLESTVGRLRSTLGAEFLIVPVRYLNFNEHEIPKEHSLQPFFFKRDTYAWEREIRIIGEMEMGKKIGSPREVSVELSTLIGKVGIHPLASDNFFQSVNMLLQEMLPTSAFEVVKIN
jgi:hypothetical protein